MVLFAILFLFIAVMLLVSFLIMGFNELNLHLTFYGFILVGVGYLIALVKRQRMDEVREHVEYIMDKKYKMFNEEIKKMRVMLLESEERRNQQTGKMSRGNIETSRKKIELELNNIPGMTKE